MALIDKQKLYYKLVDDDFYDDRDAFSKFDVKEAVLLYKKVLYFINTISLYNLTLNDVNNSTIIGFKALCNKNKFEMQLNKDYYFNEIFGDFEK